jgi:hypothetical protein
MQLFYFTRRTLNIKSKDQAPTYKFQKNHTIKKTHISIQGY